MVDSNNSRRKFIQGIAVLSTALLIESPTSIFASPVVPQGLPAKWNRFWKLQGGTTSVLLAPLKDAAIQSICHGHSYTIGEPVYFEAGQLLAQPIWIYWGHQKSEPNDVIISFFTQEEMPQKICRINKFELETLYRLATNGTDPHIVDICKENAINSTQNHTTKKSLFVKTIIRKGEPAKIVTTYFDNDFAIKNNIVYHA